jgi:AcrR family transcriptional regulator
VQNANEKTPNRLPETDRYEAVPAELDPKSARKEAINDMKRIHIMDAAMRVIARDGYMSARLEDIAEEAGFSKASIYHYFPDKEALIMHIVIREQRESYEQSVRITERGLPFLETLRELGLTFYDRFFTNNKIYVTQNGVTSVPAIMSSLLASVTKHQDLFDASIMCKKDTFELLTRIISKAKQDGVLTIPVDDHFVCIFITSFFQVLMMESMALGGSTLGQNESGMLSKETFNKALDSMFTFLSPWIKEGKDA